MDDDSSEPWGRDLAFVIAVREPDFWGASQVKQLLEQVLNFLSNDKYSFTFVPLRRDTVDRESYFEFSGSEKWPFERPERVLMFSGGLDSLAGAVETVSQGNKVVLVSHRPVSTLDAHQRALFRELKGQFPDQLFHVPVWINKDETFNRESTQRTRSFLYAALGTLVAQSVQAEGVRFYENGVVGLNLPIAEEVLRARASRTTHPVTLHLLSELCTAVTEHNFPVDNPYRFKTKTEVVTTLATHAAAHLIAHTCSCSRLMFRAKARRHCGCCSQCIDRRFATTAADLLAYDSAEDYVSDVFVGPRRSDLDRALAIDYTRHGVELARRTEAGLAAVFNAEVGRAVRYEPKRAEAAQQIIAMHRRHGEAVNRVLEQKVVDYRAHLIDGSLDKSSLLALTIRRETVQALEPQLSTSSSGLQMAAAIRSAMKEVLGPVLTGIAGSRWNRVGKRNKRKVGKRDAVIFAAILKNLKGIKYCSFLHQYVLKPKWDEDAGPPTYPRGYQAGHPWRKKIQDEKSRADKRMQSIPEQELADALAFYFPGEVDALRSLLHSRNSRHASKNPTPTEGDKH